MTKTLQNPADLSAPAATPSWREPWRVVVLLASALAMTCAWMGGYVALTGVGLGIVGVMLASRGRVGGLPGVGVDAEANAHSSQPTPGMAGRYGAEVMVTQIVPVWSRQMEVTRDASNDGLAHILGVFTEINSVLQELTQNMASMTIAPGSIDAALSRESAALDLLRSASERALVQRQKAIDAISAHCEDLEQLRKLSKRSREIARHTRLVAFNASIESSRGHDESRGGNQAVAQEVKTLADHMADTSERIDVIIERVNRTLGMIRTEGEVSSVSPEELAQEINLRAREALQALLAAVGSSSHSSTQAQHAVERLLHQLDGAYVHFQFGDRISQMLDILNENMVRFTRWVQANPKATQTDAAEWLTQLEASYTMEEQRSHHHGNVHVERGSCVEFF
jgi:methyl-accepting chemotaxis protein